MGILNCCMTCRLGCTGCKNVCDGFCSRADTAPRFARAEDLRLVVLQKYDYEFACRNVEATEEVEIAQGEDSGAILMNRVLPRAHTVDALYSCRLYHDVSCGRRSVKHNVVSEDDHLIVLAGLIMQAVWFFPSKNNMWAANPPAIHNRGRLVPRQGGANAGSNGAV